MNKKLISALALGMIASSAAIASDELVLLETQQKISPDIINSNFTYLSGADERNSVDYDNSFINNKSQDFTPLIGDVVQNSFNADLSLEVTECIFDIDGYSADDKDYTVKALIPVPKSADTNFTYDCNSLISVESYHIDSSEGKKKSNDEIGSLSFYNSPYQAAYEYTSDLEDVTSINVNVALLDGISKATISLEIPAPLLSLTSNPTDQAEVDAHKALVEHIDSSLSYLHISEMQEKN